MSYRHANRPRVPTLTHHLPPDVRSTGRWAHRSAGCSLSLQFGYLLSQERVVVVQCAIRAPQGVYRAGHAGQRQLAGSTTLPELEKLLFQKG
ncbi:MAG TPA: hypothetical protein VMJ65_26705 [Solirubrobacteraceae bacterium]|nr:hypothetical protein [Solirubrobacteraceae bacterium]